MEILKQTIALKDSFPLIGKAKDIFAPVKEAIANSLDAIVQRQGNLCDFVAKISIKIHFRTERNLLNEETSLLNSIIVEDNGVGFTSENLARFKKLAETTKKLNNRGTGKIQIFRRFNEISIDSVFTENEKWNRLNATWKLNGEYDDALVEISNQTAPKTIVRMLSFSGDEKEQEFFGRYLGNIDELRKDILKRFFLRLWLVNDKQALTLAIKVFLDDRVLHLINQTSPRWTEKKRF